MPQHLLAQLQSAGLQGWGWGDPVLAGLPHIYRETLEVLFGTPDCESQGDSGPLRALPALVPSHWEGG